MKLRQRLEEGYSAYMERLDDERSRPRPGAPEQEPDGDDPEHHGHPAPGGLDHHGDSRTGVMCSRSQAANASSDSSPALRSTTTATASGSGASRSYPFIRRNV